MAARPYCGVCSAEDVAAERAQRTDGVAGRERDALKVVVARQSAELDRAYGRLRGLRRRLRDVGRPRKPKPVQRTVVR